MPHGLAGVSIPSMALRLNAFQQVLKQKIQLDQIAGTVDLGEVARRQGVWVSVEKIANFLLNNHKDDNSCIDKEPEHFRLYSSECHCGVIKSLIGKSPTFDNHY